MDTFVTKGNNLKIFFSYTLTVLGGCIGGGFLCIGGGFLGLLVWFLIWLHWTKTVYEPWLKNQLAQGGDDGGSSEGWVLVLGAPPALLIGVATGLILAHLIFAKRIGITSAPCSE